MSIANRELIGTWDVAFLHYRWTYTFDETGGVTWRDKSTGKSGKGHWKVDGVAVAVTWDKSTARETWNLPIVPGKPVVGQMKSNQAEGWFEAKKDVARGYADFAPEGQLHANACWAACIAWTSKVLPNVQSISQQAILGNIPTGTLYENGSVRHEALTSLHFPGFNANGFNTVEEFEAKIRGKNLPVVVGFMADFGGHVNVIYDYDAADGTVGIMEPWYPKVELDPNYAKEESLQQYLHLKTGAIFKFNGLMARKHSSYFTGRLLKNSKLWLLEPA